MPGVLNSILRFDRRGATAPIIAIALPAMVGALGFGLDTAMIEIKRTSLQAAADAAATAGATKMLTPEAVSAAAIQLAAANLPVAQNGNVLVPQDVVRGYWNGTTRTFTPNSVAPASNAVQITTRFAKANGNPYKMIFGQVIGLQSPDLSASAIALSKTGCTQSTAYSLVSGGLPTRTSIVTQGNPCMPGSGWSGTCYWATPAGNPIVRVDSAYDGPAVVTFKLASPSRSFSFNAPARGSYWVVLADFTLPNTGSVTMVFNNFKSNPVVSTSSGTSTYVNKFNVTQTLPGTALCEPGTYHLASTLVN